MLSVRTALKARGLPLQTPSTRRRRSPHQPTSPATCVVILALIPAVVVLGCAGAAHWLRRNAV